MLTIGLKDSFCLLCDVMIPWKKPVCPWRSRGIKLSFSSQVSFRTPFVFFLIGPLGSPPTPPPLPYPSPICSLGSQSPQPVPEPGATWASCLQVCNGTSPGTDGEAGGTGAQRQSRRCDWWTEMRWKQTSGQRSRWEPEAAETPGEERLWFLVRSSPSKAS